VNHKANNEELLTAVLAEAAPADFRDATLGETLRRVRRQRRWRQTPRAVALLVVLGLCGVFIWQKNLPRPSFAPAPVARAVPKNYQLVQTRSLPASAMVVTQPLAVGQFITSAETVATVQTRSGNYQELTDAELLALVASHPAVLIRTGPHSEELVFANPEDQKGFPLN
jgi:hypothetical protein